ncbi:MAG: hypothetical protein HY554_04670, partial [Elusimicrobia bacterium]|nr:hypothetical protein [Elusimicrobiota bacterium]
CGRSSRVLEYLGRSDDALCVGMMNVRYRDFSAALQGLPVSTLQLAARSGEAGESVVVRVETERPCDALRRRVQARLLRASPKVAACLEKGELASLDVELFGPGELPRNARTGKVRSLVDERNLRDRAFP